MSKQKKKTKAEGVAPQVMVVAMVVAFLFGVYVGGVGFSLYQEQGEDLGQGQMRMPPGMTQGMTQGAPQGIPQGMPQAMPGGTPQQMSGQDAGASEDQAAIERLEAQVQKNPSDVAAWVHLGNHYFDSNQFKGAIRAYTKALELKPGNADVLTDLGVMYRRDKNPEKAIECFDKAIAADPAHRTARFNMGIVYLHDLNNIDAALQTWEVILKTDPDATTPDGRPLKGLIEEMRKHQ